MSENKKNKILWTVFLVTLVFALIEVVTRVFVADSPKLTSFTFLTLMLPAIVLILHAMWKLSFFRGLGFIFVSMLTGFIFEFVGLNYGIVFGGTYKYHGLGPMLYDIPLLVPLYWAVFIYAGYTISSSFLFWIGKDKPRHGQGNTILLPLLILLDGLIVTAIDVFMDPLQVRLETWVWIEQGSYSYFGVPIGNFVGWFLVTIISTGIFRFFEYFFPKKTATLGMSVFLISTIGYGAFCLIFLVSAISEELFSLALIGLFAMMPITIVNLILFLNWRERKKG